MQRFSLDSMHRGWFVGPFVPTAFHTDAVEVAVKKYRAGDTERRHHHKLATELTLVLAGQARMNGVTYVAGDIVAIAPGESTEFQALTDLTTVVVKVPAVPNDKYDGGAPC